jgi:hypothetical protein
LPSSARLLEMELKLTPVISWSGRIPGRALDA